MTMVGQSLQGKMTNQGKTGQNTRQKTNHGDEKVGETGPGT